AIGKVDAGAAQTGFLIERRAGRNVLGDVGDVDLQFVVTVLELAHVDGVIEVTRGFTVDGDDRKRAIVAPLTERARWDDGFDGLRFLEHFGGEAVRQVELADHDFDVDAEIVLVAEDFDDFAARILRGRRPVGDFDINDYVFKIVGDGAMGDFFA